MDSSPTITELIGDVYDTFIVIGIICFQTGFNQSLQQTVMFADSLNQSVRTGESPGVYKILSGKLLFPQIHRIHCAHKIQVDHSNRIDIRA